MECTKDPTAMGARLAIYPMQDNFVDVILGAVRAADRNGLAVTTDDVSTCVQGPADRVWAYVEEVYVRACAAGGHVVANLILSGGWPGEALEEAEFGLQTVPSPMPSADFPVACAWSLYPLGTPDYMDVIYREITRTLESSNVQASRSHYSSRLDGTAREIFATMRTAFEAVRTHVNHTVIHATLSKGSPSKPRTQVQL